MQIMIDSFAIVIENPAALLAKGEFVSQLEKTIMAQLPDCKHLLRWAIVALDGQACRVEGAYLK